MKILFISEYYPPKVMGGGEINLASLAKGLMSAGMEVLVLTSFFPGLARTEEQEGVKIYRRLKTGTTPSSWFSNVQRRLLFPRSVVREVQRLSIETSFDLIHFTGTSIITAPQLKKLNKPLFATIESYPALCPKGDRLYHGRKECKIACTLPRFLPCQAKSKEIGKMKNTWYVRYNLPLLLYIYWYYKRLHNALRHCRLISISTYVQELLALHEIQSSAVIPNIIEVERFSSPKTSQLPAKPRILYLGSLIESKGPQILLEAMRGIEGRCDLYGDGVLKKELLDFIRKHELDAEIHAAVPPEEVPALYAQADLVVFPSLWPEPFGRIPIEAMAAGKPIIASQSGAIPELVGNYGILVPPGDHQALHKALQRALLIKPKTKPKTKAATASLPQYQLTTIRTQLQRVYGL